MATHPTAIPKRKCSPKRNGLYVGNQTATGPSHTGKGMLTKAKCPASKARPAMSNPGHAHFFGSLVRRPITAMTVSHPVMSKAMYQSGPLKSVGKNVVG